MNLFKKLTKKKLDKIETTDEIKELLETIYEYTDNTEQMLLEQEKESKHYLERLYITTHNPQQRILDILSSILKESLNNVTFLENGYNKHSNQYRRVKDMLRNYNVVESHKKLYAVSSAFKELSSEEQWKNKDFKKYFISSIDFVTDFDSLYFHQIKFHKEYKNEILEKVKTKLIDYGYVFKNIEEMEDDLIETSRKVKIVQKNVDKLGKIIYNSESNISL